MKTNSVLGILIGCLFLGASAAQATFSIVAVDPQTGEVGSAGASCVTNALQISDLHPGVGAIHTQASNLWPNYVNGRARMNEGWSPQDIVDWLVANDAEGSPSARQYLIVDLGNGGRSAAYTGVDCDDWKGHRLGPTYAIAGNTLLGSAVVDAMEAAFLRTSGSLALRLMSALQAANVLGADTRCAADGKPAISAFIRVARPGDQPEDLYLDLAVEDTAPGVNPLDLLQTQFTAWMASEEPLPTPAPSIQVFSHPNPFNPGTEISFWLARSQAVRLSVFDLRGREVCVLVDSTQSEGWHAVGWTGEDSTGRGLATGMYFARLATATRSASCRLTFVK